MLVQLSTGVLEYHGHEEQLTLTPSDIAFAKAIQEACIANKDPFVVGTLFPPSPFSCSFHLFFFVQNTFSLQNKISFFPPKEIYFSFYFIAQLTHFINQPILRCPSPCAWQCGVGARPHRRLPHVPPLHTLHTQRVWRRHRIGRGRWCAKGDFALFCFVCFVIFVVLFIVCSFTISNFWFIVAILVLFLVKNVFNIFF